MALHPFDTVHLYLHLLCMFLLASFCCTKLEKSKIRTWMNTFHRSTDYIWAAHSLSLLNVAEHQYTVCNTSVDCTVDIEIGEGWYWKLQLQNCIRFKITFLSILYSLSDLEPCLLKRKVKWRFWLDFSQDGIHTASLLQRQSKQSMEPSRGGFQGRSLLKYCNQVSCGENKAFNGMREREEGTFPSLRDTQVSTGTETEERRMGKPNSKDALQSTSSGSSAFWCTKCSLPRTLTHTCVCAGHSTQPRKKA